MYSQTINNGVLNHDERNLDAEAVRSISEIHKRSPWPRACRTMLHSMILQKELVFSKAGKTVTTPDLPIEFREIVRKHWIKFAALCVDEIFIAGFVVYTYVRLPSGDMVPVVLDSENMGTEYDVTIRRDRKKHQNVYRVYKKKGPKGEPLNPRTHFKSAHVLTGFGADPSLDGTINSKLVPMLKIESERSKYERALQAADDALARPPIFLETDQERASNIDTSAALDAFADADREVAHRTNTMLFARPKQGVEAYAAFSSSMARAAEKSQELLNEPFYLNNVFYIPPGHKPVQVQQPTRPPDFEAHYLQYQQDVCTTYGLPRSLFIQDTHDRGVGNTVLTNETKRQTITFVVESVSRILTGIYNDLYFETDFRTKANEMKSALAGPISAGDFFNAVKSVTETTVKLPMPPTVDPDELIRLRILKLIDWESFSTNMLSVAGVPAQKLTPEPSDKEFKKRFLLSQGQDPDPPTPTALPGAGPKPKSGTASGPKKAASTTPKGKNERAKDAVDASKKASKTQEKQAKKT